MSADDLTPAVTQSGRIIWLDADGNREFSPRTQATIRTWTLRLFVLLILLALGIATGLVPAAPWSPLGA